MTAVLDIKSSRAAKKQHDAIVAWTWEQFTRMKNARTIIERQWYLDLSFYFGKQHVAFIRPGQRGFASGSTKLWVPPAPYWRARPVINRIRPTIRTEIAQLTNNKPNATVVPASAEERDMYAAMAAEQIWESIYTEKKLKATFRRSVWWNQVCGNAYIKTWWDFTKGPIDPETGSPVGDICFTHITPFHVFVPDLLEEEIEEQPYIIHAQTKSPEYIQMRYKTGVDGEQIKTVETTGREILEESFLNLIGNSSTTNKQRSVLEFEVWVKPDMHPNFPEGAMFTVVGDKIVQDFTGLPYSHGKYPFAKLDHIPSGKYYSTSSVEDLISLQKEYNRCYDDKTEILTNKGWKYGINLQVGDTVLAFDPATKSMSFSPVREIFHKEYSGPLTVLENQQISSRTTPGHKWFVKTSNNEYKIVTELNSYHSIPLCAPVKLQGDDNYEFNKIVGLVLTDGRINDNRVLISQSNRANYGKCNEIESLLENEGIVYSTYGPNKYGMIDYYIPIEYSAKIKQVIPNKRLTPDYIMTLGSKGLQGLYDGMIMGDGMIKENKGDRFYTSLESEADLFQMVANLLGRVAKKRKQLAKSDWSIKSYQYIVTVKTEKFSKATVFRAKKKDEYYEGTVWCPTVDTGFVFVRRNGTSYVSGNTHGQIIENKNRMAKLQLMAERGAVDASKMTSEPGQLIEYTPGFNKPEAAPAPPLPSYVMQTLDRILQDWNDISGQHEVTHGQVPPGVTAATAISFLQERDETKLSPTFDSLEESIEKTAQMALTLIHDYWTVEKIIKITGPDGSFDSLTFKGSDLANNLDIRVEAGSALPTSKAAKQAFVLDLMKLGFVDPNDGLEVLDMGGMTKIYEKVQTDRRQAQRENLRMSKVTDEVLQQYQQQNDELLQQDPNHFGSEPQIDEMTGQPVIDPNTGQPVESPLDPPILISVNSWDNHQAHIMFHNQYRKGQAFENLPESAKQLFEAHVRQHIEALGIESETMKPRVAAGLPPENPEEMQQGQQQNKESPGPESMPNLESGG